MRIEILDEAQEDLIQGFHFYERLEIGVGSYFLGAAVGKEEDETEEISTGLG